MSIKDKEKLIKELENKDEIISCAIEFGVMGDETRLRICYLLCKHPELSVTDMAEVLGLTVSAVSHSLAKLKSSNVVSSRRDKQAILYSLQDTKLTKFIKTSLKG